MKRVAPPAGFAGGAASRPRTESHAPRWAALFQPVDIASLGVFRVGFGLLLASHIFSHLTEGLVEALYVAPPFHFTFPGFDWVRPLPEPWMTRLFWALLLSALAIAVGFLYRLAAAAFTIGYLYVMLVDAAAYNNHTYLIFLLALLMAVVPAHRSLSADARRRHELRADTVPAWALWLLRFQVAIPYLYGGINKLGYDWLVRAQPLGIWLPEGKLHLQGAWIAYAMSWAGLLLDLLAVPALLWRRSRPFAVAVLIAFHLANAMVFRIGVFPWLMIWATSLFLSPSWPRRARLLRSRAAAPGRTPRLGRAHAAVGIALALYAAVQLLVPLRHLVYPGPVDWTEEGHRFAWRMKLRDKRGQVEFVGVDRKSLRTLRLTGIEERLLNDRQWQMMVHDPDMIRQFSGYLARRLGEAGYGDLEIRVVSKISLNGRAKQALVDPAVDLARMPRTPPPAPWIVPLAE